MATNKDNSAAQDAAKKALAAVNKTSSSNRKGISIISDHHFLSYMPVAFNFTAYILTKNKDENNKNRE